VFLVVDDVVFGDVVGEELFCVHVVIVVFEDVCDCDVEVDVW